MSNSKILAILVFSSLAVTSAAGAGEITRGNAHMKAPKGAVVAAVPLPPSRHLLKEAPIVMGRSASVPRKSKLRHVKAKPSESIEQTIAPISSSEASLFTVQR